MYVCGMVKLNRYSVINCRMGKVNMQNIIYCRTGIDIIWYIWKQMKWTDIWLLKNGWSEYVLYDSLQRLKLNKLVLFSMGGECGWFVRLWLPVEKRFMMRPAGVVSKKDIGARMILSRSWLCSFLEAITPPMIMDSEKPKTPATEWFIHGC